MQEKVDSNSNQTIQINPRNQNLQIQQHKNYQQQVSYIGEQFGSFRNQRKNQIEVVLKQLKDMKKENQEENRMLQRNIHELQQSYLGLKQNGRIMRSNQNFSCEINFNNKDKEKVRNNLKKMEQNLKSCRSLGSKLADQIQLCKSIHLDQIRIQRMNIH